MNFCAICNNTLYLTEIENKLYLQCKKCGSKIKNNKTIISSKVYTFVETEDDPIHNKYVTFDNTLPRTNKKICVNSDCKKSEAVFYPDKKTREISYVCCFCYTKWKLT